ncbi:hypothetical protein [Streptomyces sp. CLCI03]
MYPGLDFNQAELASVMRKNYDDLIEFVTSPAFKKVHAELMDLPEPQRPAFIMEVLLRPDEMRKRGVEIPPGILIQMSAFGDRRPTLFAVKKFLPKKYHGAWENVNITFSNSYDEEDVSREGDVAWRAPMPVALQNALIANGDDLESVHAHFELQENNGMVRSVAISEP